MTQTKECTNCKKALPFQSFTKNASKWDGLQSQCKECGKAYAREWGKKNRKRKRGYSAKWEQKNPEAIKAIRSRAGKTHRELHPVRTKARVQFKLAIIAGKISRPKTCSKCGVNGLIQGHHEDYSKPLDVVWLCLQCHQDRHQELRA